MYLTTEKATNTALNGGKFSHCQYELLNSLSDNNGIFIYLKLNLQHSNM